MRQRVLVNFVVFRMHFGSQDHTHWTGLSMSPKSCMGVLFFFEVFFLCIREQASIFHFRLCAVKADNTSVTPAGVCSLCHDFLNSTQCYTSTYRQAAGCSAPGSRAPCFSWWVTLSFSALHNLPHFAPFHVHIHKLVINSAVTQYYVS